MLYRLLLCNQLDLIIVKYFTEIELVEWIINLIYEGLILIALYLK